MPTDRRGRHTVAAAGASKAAGLLRERAAAAVFGLSEQGDLWRVLLRLAGSSVSTVFDGPGQLLVVRLTGGHARARTLAAAAGVATAAALAAAAVAATVAWAFGWPASIVATAAAAVGLGALVGGAQAAVLGVGRPAAAFASAAIPAIFSAAGLWWGQTLLTAVGALAGGLGLQLVVLLSLLPWRPQLRWPASGPRRLWNTGGGLAAARLLRQGAGIGEAAIGVWLLPAGVIAAVGFSHQLFVVAAGLAGAATSAVLVPRLADAGAAQVWRAQRRRVWGAAFTLAAGAPAASWLLLGWGSGLGDGVWSVSGGLAVFVFALPAALQLRLLAAERGSGGQANAVAVAELARAGVWIVGFLVLLPAVRTAPVLWAPALLALPPTAGTWLQCLLLQRR